MVMKKLASSWGNVMWFGWSFAAVMVVTVFPLAAAGAERTVLAEYFNALW
jgi:hypothetical protein